MENLTWRCMYGARTYEVTFDISRTPYRNMLPSVMSLHYLPYYSTIDDPVVMDVASQLDEQLAGARDRVRSNVVLALVQQNVRYVTDEERFGMDVWETPAYVLEHGAADCDGSADFCTSIAYNLGLDVVSVVLLDPKGKKMGHMCSAVNVPGSHGRHYPYGGKEFYHLEITGTITGVGGFDNMDLIMADIAPPEKPTASFRSVLRPVNEFV